MASVALMISLMFVSSTMPPMIISSKIKFTCADDRYKSTFEYIQAKVYRAHSIVVEDQI